MQPEKSNKIDQFYYIFQGSADMNAQELFLLVLIFNLVFFTLQVNWNLPVWLNKEG